MHDIWNPWHGCRKASEGCDNCYMFTMDRWRGLDGGQVRRNKAGFRYPLSRTRDGLPKVRAGELIRVCMTSDFFVDEADSWRDEAWDIMRERPDVRFWLLTKRPERFATCLPKDWGDGWENVMLNVTCENQRRADERIPMLLATPARHKGIMCAPFIGQVDIERYLVAGDAYRMARQANRQGAVPETPEMPAIPGTDFTDRAYEACESYKADGSAEGVDDVTVRGCGIEQVICGGENYEGARPCDFAWVQLLARQCRDHHITFAFIETGSVFVKDGRTYRMPSHRLQSEQARKSGVSFRGRPIEWHLTDPLGMEIPNDELYRPQWIERCEHCGQQIICNGCARCGRCE